MASVTVIQHMEADTVTAVMCKGLWVIVQKLGPCSVISFWLNITLQQINFVLLSHALL